MKNIGILVNNLGTTQLSYCIIRNINKYYRDGGDDVSFSLFYENLQQPCLEPNFAVYRILESFEFPGDLIATDISTAMKLNNIPIQGNRHFLSWDIEWSRKILPFEHLEKTYLNPKNQILCRSDDHYNLLKKVFNINATTVLNFNIEDIILCTNSHPHKNN